MTDKEAMVKALEALEQMKAKANFECWNLDVCDEAITAIKERLAQPEQEPVAWADHGVVNWIADKQFKHASLLYTTPPQRNPLTDEQRQELMSKAWNKWLSRKDNGRLFAWEFSFEVEAAHGIKEDT